MNPLFMHALAARRIDALVIGASAGGIAALLAILPALAFRYTFPVIVVLHLPDDGDSRLPEVLAQRLGMLVEEAKDKHPALGGVIYVAPCGYHLSIEPDRHFSLSREEPVHFSRPAIDILMTSAADVYRSSMAGILLTGASADGAVGMERISAAGGLTIVQHPDEAEIATMPLRAIAARAPNLILTLSQIYELLSMLEIH